MFNSLSARKTKLRLLVEQFNLTLKGADMPVVRVATMNAIMEEMVHECKRVGERIQRKVEAAAQYDATLTSAVVA